MKSFYKNAKGIAVSFVISLPVVSCAVTPHSEQMKYKPLQEDATPTVVDHRSTYVREVTPEESFQSNRISFVGEVALIDAIRKQLPGVGVMPADANVDMSRSVSVYARNMSATDFLEYLSSITGYDIKFEKGQIVIRSFVRKEWNMAIFSSKRNVNLQVGKAFSSEVGGANNTFNGKFSDDEWNIVIKGAERILGTTNTASKKGELTPFVHGVRSIGLLSAGGEPHKIKALDEFISSIVARGSKQINISVQAYEVLLDDKRGAGINWQQLTSIGGTLNGNPFNVGLETSDVNNIGELFKSVVTYENGEGVTASAMFNFLSTFGEVELLNQPNVTVRNGTYAYISAGDEITYVGEVQIEDENNSDDDKVTVKVESVRVGVTLSVAPRILDDGKILLEIWPSISSADLSEKFTLGNNNMTLPKIELQELATEVITESGRPVQLGGFISRKISKSLSELPWREKITGKMLNPLFKSEKADLERSELVLTVTPTIVEGV